MTGRDHPFSRSQPQQVDFEFGEGGQDVEEHLSHWIGWVVHLAAERQLMPRAARSSPIARASGMDRASRSSFGTTSVAFAYRCEGLV